MKNELFYHKIWPRYYEFVSDLRLHYETPHKGIGMTQVILERFWMPLKRSGYLQNQVKILNLKPDLIKHTRMILQAPI